MKSGKRLLSALLVLALLLLPAAMAEQDAAEAFFLTPEAGAEESLSLESEAESAEESLPLETEEESAEESFSLESEEEAAPSDASMVEAHTLTISDPRVTVGGVDLLDLEGLRVEGTFAGDDDTADVLLRLLGGDDVAAEGYASFDGRSIVFGADGLSSDYALPLEKMAGGMNGFSPAVGMAAETAFRKCAPGTGGQLSGRGGDVRRGHALLPRGTGRADRRLCHRPDGDAGLPLHSHLRRHGGLHGGLPRRARLHPHPCGAYTARHRLDGREAGPGTGRLQRGKGRVAADGGRVHAGNGERAGRDGRSDRHLLVRRRRKSAGCHAHCAGVRPRRRIPLRGRRLSARGRQLRPVHGHGAGVWRDADDDAHGRRRLALRHAAAHTRGRDAGGHGSTCRPLRRSARRHDGRHLHHGDARHAYRRRRFLHLSPGL